MVVPLGAHYSHQEKWVWARIIAGEVADLSQWHGEQLDPDSSAEAWANPEKPRLLSERFILTILTNPCYSDRVPYRGARIVGAWCDTNIDLSHTIFKRPLKFTFSRFEGKVALDWTRLEHLVLEHCVFGGHVSMFEASIVQTLSFCGSRFDSTVNLRRARVGNTVLMDGSIFETSLDMGGIEIGLDFFLRDQATFKGGVSLLGAKIHGTLETGNAGPLGATFHDHLNMGGVEVGGSLFLSGQTVFLDKVTIIEARIGNSLDAFGSIFHGMPKEKRVEPNHSLNLTRTEITYSLHLGRSKFFNDVIALGARVGSNLDVSGAEFHTEVNLTGVKVDGELRLGSRVHGRVRWRPNARLILRNAKVSTIHDGEEKGEQIPAAWPATSKLEINGLTYDRLGGGDQGAIQGHTMMGRSSEWYISWLKLNESDAPQPYEHLARVLRDTGEEGKADDILFAGRERGRKAVKRQCTWWPGARWLGLWLLRSIVGYGIGLRYFHVLWWVGGFTVFGAWLTMAAGQGPPVPELVAENYLGLFLQVLDILAVNLVYSLDQLLPIVQIDKSFDDITLGGLAGYWFYVHRLAGWVLGSFLIAALSGLTRNQRR